MATSESFQKFENSKAVFLEKARNATAIGGVIVGGQEMEDELVSH